MKTTFLHHNPNIASYFQEQLYEATESQAETEIIVAGAKTELDAISLANYPKLKYIIQCSNGINTIDTEYTKHREIKIFNAPTANANATAEYVVALILSCLRKIPFADKTIKEGKWERRKFTSREIRELNIGLIGFGAIAKLVHKKLTGFDPKQFLVVDPFLSKEQIEIDERTKKVEIDQLLKESDIITIHVPLLDATRNLINTEEFKTMKDQATLLNCSRGGIVNEQALITALEEGEKNEGKQLFAALDVFPNEPEVNPELLNFDNLILSPHIASMSKSAQERMILEAKRRFEESLEQEK